MFDYYKVIQTGLSSLSDTLFDVVQGLPYKYANLTAFSTLSDDYDAFKITNNSNISTIYSDIDNLTTNLSVLNVVIGCTRLRAVSGILRTQRGRRGSGLGRLLAGTVFASPALCGRGLGPSTPGVGLRRPPPLWLISSLRRPWPLWLNSGRRRTAH